MHAAYQLTRSTKATESQVERVTKQSWMLIAIDGQHWADLSTMGCKLR